MRTLSARGRLVVMSSCLLAWGTLYACTPEDENPATNRARGGDASTTGTGTVDVDGSTSTPAEGAAICAKYGGEAAVKQLATNILASAKGDCRIASNFGGADAAHLNECFQIFVAGSFLCPGNTFQQGTTTDSKKQKCESVVPGVKFSLQDWRVFADFNAKPSSLAVTHFTNKGLSAEELKQIGIAFEQKKVGLLNNDVPQGKFTLCAANCPSGGDACNKPIIDAGPDTGTPIQDSGTPDSGDVVDGG